MVPFMHYFTQFLLGRDTIACSRGNNWNIDINTVKAASRQDLLLRYL